MVRLSCDDGLPREEGWHRDHLGMVIRLYGCESIVV